MTRSFIYGLTNFEFLAPEIVTSPDGSWIRNKLTFPYKNMICCLEQAPNYKQIIDQLSKEHGAGISAYLTITGDDSLSCDTANELADAICELLAFATKNTVFWIDREVISPLEGESSFFRRSLAGRVRNFHSGWSVIDDVVNTEAGPRFELKVFLSSVFEKYFDILRTKLKTPLLWINESEHLGFVDLRFITLYIAIERLRIEFLPKSSYNYIHVDWQNKLNGQLALDILTLIENSVGNLSEDQKRTLISKLRSADSPSSMFLLDELCRGLGVTGLERDMNTLRNKLTHTASYGSFDFSKVIKLQGKLSHVVDVCILKILDYDGYYCHKNTEWHNVRLTESHH